MNVKVNGTNALVDEKIEAKVTDLTPGSRVKVSLDMEFPWCKGEQFTSYAIFAADEKGEVDLSIDKPLEGSYEKADSMGLVYSLRKSKSEGGNIAAGISIKEPITMNMVFETEGFKEEFQLKRHFKAEDVLVEEISESFEGMLFYKENSKNKTVLMFGGSDGQLQALTLMAGPMASRGFNVLIASYFGAIGVPEKLEMVPLEHFENIFEWIDQNEITNTSEIYLHGTSKGAELALLLASRYKQVSKVVAVEPHAYCFQGLDGLMSGKNVSSWSYEGESIPFVEVDNNIFFEDFKKDVENGVPFGFASTYKKSIERADNREAARIKVENAEAKLLMITGKADNIWNSHDGCMEIMKHLKAKDYKHKVELMAYENMGHPLPIPYIIPLSETLAMPMNGGVFSSGGTVEGNAEAQYESWKRTLEFLGE